MKRARKYPLPTEKVLEAENLPAAELRMLVANYYQAQQMRKAMDMQMRHLGDRQPHYISTYAATAFADIEEQIAKAFTKILTTKPAQWLNAQRGIGPVISAGLLAHIDITKAPTAGRIWRFAGLDPTLRWISRDAADKIVSETLKKQGVKTPDVETVGLTCGHTSHKPENILARATRDHDGKPCKMTVKTLAAALARRPYNAELKQLTWHAGQCFMKQSNDPDCFYGQLYRSRKAFEIARNERGDNAERAKTFKVSSGATKAVKDKLKNEQLPDFNIDARARRYAVKIFLSHLHAVLYFDHFKKAPPKPFPISILGHADEIHIPHVDVVPGLAEALYGRPMSEAAE
jgi:hypothetical protein